MFVKKKNKEFNFLAKLMSKLVCLANAVVLNNVFFFKSLNTIITIKFDLIVAILDSAFEYFIYPYLLSSYFRIIISSIIIVMDNDI